MMSIGFWYTENERAALRVHCAQTFWAESALIAARWRLPRRPLTQPMLRTAYLALLAFAPLCVAFNPTVTPALPTTPRAEADDMAQLSHDLQAVIEGLIARHGGSVAAVKTKVVDTFSQMRASSPKTTLDYLKHLYNYGPRRLQASSALETTLGDLLSVIEGAFSPTQTITSFADMWPRIQAITCAGNVGSPTLISALSGALDADTLSELSITSAQITSLTTDFLGCVCSDAWDFSDTAYVTLFAQIRSTIDPPASATSETTVNNLISSGTGVVHLFLGANGLCSMACQSAFLNVWTLGLSLASTAAGLPPAAQAMAASARARMPRASVTCMCTAFAVPNMVPNVVAQFGTNPYAQIAILFDGELQAQTPHWIDTFIQKSVDAVSYFMNNVMCTNECKVAFAAGNTFGWSISLSQFMPDSLLNGLIHSDTGLTLPLSVLPNEGQIAAFSTSMTNCICGMDYSKFTRKLLQYIGSAGQVTFPTEAGPIIDVIEVRNLRPSMPSMPFQALPRLSMPLHALPRPSTPCHALPRPATPFHALSCPSTPFHALL